MSLKSIAEKRASFDDEHGTGKEVTKSDIKNHIKSDQKEFTQLKTKAESIENTVEDMKEEDAQTLEALNKESALIQKIAQRVMEKVAISNDKIMNATLGRYQSNMNAGMRRSAEKAIGNIGRFDDADHLASTIVGAGQRTNSPVALGHQVPGGVKGQHTESYGISLLNRNAENQAKRGGTPELTVAGNPQLTSEQAQHGIIKGVQDIRRTASEHAANFANKAFGMLAPK